MKTKKGGYGIPIMITLVFLFLMMIGMILLWNVSYQHGTSRDIVQGYDKGILWYHAYLKNDHFTAYCFDDEKFIPMFDKAQKEQIEVVITYKKYVGRGFWCTTAENYENVIVENVDFVYDERRLENGK